MDKRTTPARRDLAASSLRGKVEADRFVQGTLMQTTAPVAALRAAPRDDAPMETQLLFGETFVVYEEKDGWAWGQAGLDDYVGYVDIAALSAPAVGATHKVTALRTYIFSAPDVKSPPKGLISMNAQLTVQEQHGRFFAIESGGFVFDGHAAPIAAAPRRDYVAIAERFLGAPYLWGGRESLGLDCSALVQNALHQAGASCPRDSDMQHAALGVSLGADVPGIALQRGDLIFWRGHVAIMIDDTHILHANATHMEVSINPLAEFIDMALADAGPVSDVKRLDEVLLAP